MYPLALRDMRKKPRKIIRAFFLLSAVAVLAYSGYYMYDYMARQHRYDRLIEQTAVRYGLDSRLLRAVIWRESNFRADIRGRRGEIGLMQIMPGPNGAVQDWADARKIPSPCDGLLFDPELNIDIGAWYLARALRYWQPYSEYMSLALCEYNAGRKYAKIWKPVTYDGSIADRINFKSTNAYVQAIMKKYRELTEREE